ncbi:hypothetical protein [Paenibacillus sp. CF384]|uniref:hypothetical protein n=1 Tax=Paenibacillus sp. CF384 TaxID=1884382 RepID=UPI00089B8908|nr:hypothetical protein [Paenibacillus sp. CF384]SDW31243.1 hypothetical protein SAMN05518855_10011040 [Paenibacillus sp. CF384]
MVKKSQKDFLSISDDVTRVLIIIFLLLLAAVLISQLALQIPAVRLWVTGVDRLEGTPF